MKQCPNCNTPNEDAAMFCEKCGAQLPQAEPAAPAAPAAGWGSAPAYRPAAQKEVDGFHRGYANALKIVAYIMVALSALAVLVTCTVAGGALGFFLGLLGAVVTAFLVWFLIMYKVKMFDLASKNAMINSMILEELRKGEKK